MVFRCDLCQKLHKKCDGDGSNPCSRCQSRGVDCLYLNKRKPGPRQGWVNDLKMKVQKLQSEVAYGVARPVDTVTAQVTLHPDSFGMGEMPMLVGFFQNSNSVLPIVPFSDAESFRRHIETATSSHEATAARSALYNGVLALSILLEMPKNAAVFNASAVSSTLGRANNAINPYFRVANAAMKETFATPSVDAISALLVLSNCHQLMNDSQTSFLYTTYATAMASQIRDVPQTLRTSCKFFSDVRSLGLIPIEPFPAHTLQSAEAHARFLDIMAHVMVLLRAQHCPNARAKVQEMYSSSQHILALIEEADMLSEHGRIQGLPSAAKFWVHAVRARFLVNSAVQAGGGDTSKVDMSKAVEAYTSVLDMVTQEPIILRDPYAVYVCYSLTWIVLDLDEVLRAPFPDLRQQLGLLATVWPLAEAMLDILKVDTNNLEKPNVCMMMAKKASLMLEAPPQCMSYAKEADQKAKEAAAAQPPAAAPAATNNTTPPAPGPGIMLPVQMSLSEVPMALDEAPAMQVSHSDPSGSSVESTLGAAAEYSSADAADADQHRTTQRYSYDNSGALEYGVPAFTAEETEVIADFILAGFADFSGEGQPAADSQTIQRSSLDDFDFDGLDHFGFDGLVSEI